MRIINYRGFGKPINIFTLTNKTEMSVSIKKTVLTIKWASKPKPLQVFVLYSPS